MNHTILKNHQNLFSGYEELIDNLKRDGLEGRQKIVIEKENVPSYLRDFEFNISSWPVLISGSTAAELKDVTNRFPEIVKKCIGLAIKDRRPHLAELLNTDELSINLFKSLINQINSHFFRIDLLFNNSSIKLVESNLGTDAGGWQIGGIKDQFISHIIPHLNDDKKISYTDPLKMFFQSIRTGMNSHLGKTQNNDVLLLIDEASPEMREALEKDYHNIYTKTADSALYEGSLSLTNEISSLRLENDGTVSYKGNRISVLLTGNLTLSPEMLSGLTMSHIRKKLFFPENSFYKLLENKVNFALMHEYINSEELSIEERDYISKYIPWTIHCYSRKDSLVQFDGGKMAIEELLINRKDDMLVKPIDGHSGEGVSIGLFHDKEEWSDIVSRVCRDARYIAQKYYKPDMLYSADSQGNFAVTSPIWGLFSFLGDYSGGFVRHDFSDSAYSKGVINASRGAYEACILEVLN